MPAQVNDLAEAIARLEHASARLKARAPAAPPLEPPDTADALIAVRRLTPVAERPGNPAERLAEATRRIDEAELEVRRSRERIAELRSRISGEDPAGAA